MKTEITKNDKYAIIGLLILAKKNNDALNDIIVALRDITGEEDGFGHCADSAYCNDTADNLIKKLHLKVVK